MSTPWRARAILADLMRPPGRVEHLPQLLVCRCARSLSLTSVGLTLMTGEDHPAGLIAATDGVATALDELQFLLGEGPGIDASRNGRAVMIANLLHSTHGLDEVHSDPPDGWNGPVEESSSTASAPDRWPVFTPAAHDAGAEAVFAFPLRVGALRVGVLTLYRDQTGDLNHSEVAVAAAYAEAATTVLLDLRPDRLEPPVPPRPGRAGAAEPALPDVPGPYEEVGEDASTAITELPSWAVRLVQQRAGVHQATGVVSVTAAVTLAQALVLLRGRAYVDGRSVDAMAADVVSGAVRITDPSSDGDRPRDRVLPRPPGGRATPPRRPAPGLRPEPGTDPTEEQETPS